MSSTKRTVCSRDLFDMFKGDEVDTNYLYDIDADIDILAVNFKKQTMKPSPRLAIEQWKDLSVEARKIWSSLPDCDKAIIIHGQQGSTKAHPQPSYYQNRPARNANNHIIDDVDNYIAPTADDDCDDNSTDHTCNVVAMVSKQKSFKPNSKSNDTPPHDICCLLSSNSKRDNDAVSKEITINGKVYRQCNTHIIYSVSATSQQTYLSLVDRGASGGIAGSDVCVISKTLHSVDIQGIDNHQIQNIPIVTAGGVVHSQRGPVIAILNQYAYVGRGRSIHSSCQLEWYKNEVNDRSIKVGGLQQITTLDGYIHPLNIVGGLPYVNMRPYTDDEWDTLPHVIWSRDNDWDPTVLGHHLDEDEEWYDATDDLTHSFDQRFNDIGDYQRRVVVQDAVIHPNVQEDDCIDHYHRLNTLYEIHNSIYSSPPTFHST
jgi:hypothetical protein